MAVPHVSFARIRKCLHGFKLVEFMIPRQGEVLGSISSYKEEVGIEVFGLESVKHGYCAVKLFRVQHDKSAFVGETPYFQAIGFSSLGHQQLCEAGFRGSMEGILTPRSTAPRPQTESC